MKKTLIILAIVSIVTFRFTFSPGIDNKDVTSSVNHIEKKPFVYRFASAEIARQIAKIIPNNLVDSIASKFPEGHRIHNWKAEHIAVIILAFFSFLGFYFAFKALYKSIYYVENFPICALAVLLVPLLFSYAGYIYDPLELLLFTLGLYWTASERFLFLILVPLMAFSKETTILLYFYFFAVNYRWLIEKLRLTVAFIVSFTCWIIIHQCVVLLFINSPGSDMIISVHHNLEILISPFSWQFLFATLVVGLFFYKFNNKPFEIRLSLWYIVPMFVLYLIGGFYDEPRALLEAYPMVFLGVYEALKIKNN
jgi:hypothetical protein